MFDGDKRESLSFEPEHETIHKDSAIGIDPKRAMARGRGLLASLEM